MINKLFYLKQCKYLPLRVQSGVIFIGKGAFSIGEQKKQYEFSDIKKETGKTYKKKKKESRTNQRPCGITLICIMFYLLKLFGPPAWVTYLTVAFELHFRTEMEVTVLRVNEEFIGSDIQYLGIVEFFAVYCKV